MPQTQRDPEGRVVAGCRFDLCHARRASLDPAGVQGGLGKVSDDPRGHRRMMGRVGGVEEALGGLVGVVVSGCSERGGELSRTAPRRRSGCHLSAVQSAPLLPTPALPRPRHRASLRSPRRWCPLPPSRAAGRARPPSDLPLLRPGLRRPTWRVALSRFLARRARMPGVRGVRLRAALQSRAEQRVADVEGADGDRGVAEVQQGLRVVTALCGGLQDVGEHRRCVAERDRRTPGWPAPSGRRRRRGDLPPPLGPPRRGTGAAEWARVATSHSKAKCRSRSPAWPACSAAAINAAAHVGLGARRLVISSIHVARARSSGPGSSCSASRSSGATMWSCPSSKATSAAATRRPARCAGSLSSAARRSAVAATPIAPRRRARRPASSSSRATSSCSPAISAARCQTRRSRSAFSVSANASCTRRRFSTLALWRTAERISGCRSARCARRAPRSSRQLRPAGS